MTCLLRATGLALATSGLLAASPAPAATFDLRLSPTADGLTRLDFTASGRVDTPGAGSDLTWANLIGGNPFDDSLQFARVDVEPIQTVSGIHFIGLTLDSDGDAPPGGQDDLTLRFDALVASDDLLTTATTTRTLNLDFARLNPGAYTRLTGAGELNLTILASPVPLPGTATLMLGGLVWLAVARRRSLRVS